jgi:predicted nucleic acid-binding protein
MLAIDANVIVRYVVGDHRAQSARAKALIESADIFVPTSVLLETEWVLRGAYGFLRQEIAAALAAFAGLPSVTLENPASVAKAIQWAGEGMDFADALHLANAQSCDAFASFDRQFAKAANALSQVKVRAP